MSNSLHSGQSRIICRRNLKALAKPPQIGALDLDPISIYELGDLQIKDMDLR